MFSCLSGEAGKVNELTDYSVGKFQDVWSMSEWSQRDWAIQAKPEHQDKGVFPNQVNLQIRRFLTKKEEGFQMTFLTE